MFIDYNQNARDKTIASAYSVRHTGFVSTPFTWDELETIETSDWTIPAFAERYAELGDLTAGIDDDPGDLTPVLEMVRLDQEERGLGDAPGHRTTRRCRVSRNGSVPAAPPGTKRVRALERPGS